MRIAVCHPQTPFARGGAEMHTESLAKALREAGHEADVLSIPFKWYPPAELVHQMAMWRSLDLSEAHGQTVDMVIALRFPSYLVPHEHKVVWLIHQHRTAYELWDHPDFGDISHHDEGDAVRDLIHRADRIALGEAKRIFTNSANVRDRLWRSLGMPAEVLYHRSSLCEALLRMDAGPPGDYVLFPSRLDPIKRQSLAVEAMRHVRGDVRLVLVGTGPMEGDLRQQVARAGLDGRVELAGHVSEGRLLDLYRGALAVYYGPYDEDFGYVTQEAMAARRPVVVTTDSGGPLEFVRDGATGFVVEPKPRSIATAFDRLAADPSAAGALGTEGRASVEQAVPDWPEVVARLLG
ncbi:MAG TPA: glycosyltransferase family 4 protein [Actinomycetota bacterium]|nr:glycosyltransferase family 4 protein [Actinomycetota bacterium]